MVGENVELLELPKEPSNKFHDFGHFPKKNSTKRSKFPTACPDWTQNGIAYKKINL